MTGSLLDTNVLSEFSRSAAPPNPDVKRWLESADPETLYSSVMSFGEIRKGIELLAPGKKRTDLERWFERDLKEWFGSNLLPVTKQIANHWGILTARAQQQGRQIGNIDGLIAATALEHQLTVITRNVKDFSSLGVSVFDPWQPDLRLV